jgi:type I restriction enzyme S subunit
MSSKLLVPRLRFPEYLDSHPWQLVRLADVLVETNQRSDGKCQVYSVSVHKGLVNQIEHLGRSYAADDTSNYKLVMPYDVVYTKSPTGEFPFGIVKQSQLDHNAIVSPLYGVFRPTNPYVGLLIDAYFEFPPRANRYLEPISKKGAKNTIQISNDTFLSKSIPLPADKDEQEKVARLVTNLGNLIAKESDLVQRLRAHKQGLMQSLFPSPEGDE